MIIMQVTNKVFIVFSSKETLSDTNTFLYLRISKNRSLMTVKFCFFFKFEIAQFLYSFLYVKLNFYVLQCLLFWVKSAFSVNFIASFMLIKLIIQR